MVETLKDFRILLFWVVYVFGAMCEEGQMNFERQMLGGKADWELLGDTLEPRPVSRLAAGYLPLWWHVYPHY